MVWSNHGVYGAGVDLDDVFGVIETVEKTAQIYMITLGHVKNIIPDDILKAMVELFKLNIKSGILK